VSEDAFRTLAGPAVSEFTVRGSRFIGRVAPVEDVGSAEALAERTRTEYDDATHVVPAYRVRTGDGMLREYASDDGEPSGSAGEPALNALRGRELENVAAAVVRYYGGTNLGVGGLVRAYGRSVSDAVEAADVVERRPHRSLAVEVAYDDSGTVRGILESAGAEFEADYGEAVRFDARVPVEEADALRDRLLSATGGRADLKDDPE
jgi:uncharacterized YigZ family protein